MVVNEYLLQALGRERQAEERRWARASALATLTTRPGRPPRWRTALGRALIRLGRALSAEPTRRRTRPA